VKVVAYMALPVGLVLAIVWLKAFHGPEAWAQTTWKVFWFVVVPVLILIGGRIALRSGRASKNSGEPMQ
jgi:lipopolysaccharide export LptBFGC system permease protein LptF